MVGAVVSDYNKPRTVQKALEGPDGKSWRKAIDEEYRKLKDKECLKSSK